MNAYGDKSHKIQPLRIGGVVPLTTTDLPGQLSAVIFCQGCPWQCRYCHNTHLIPTTSNENFPWDTVIAFLKRRRGILDAVVFSGGEPTMQPAIVDAVKTVHAEGFIIGLHTAGQYPERLKKLLPYLSWVGFDVKAPFGSYEKVTQRKNILQDKNIQESLSLLIDAGITIECRTTLHRSILNEEELVTIAKTLRQRGIKKYVIQHFRSQGCVDQKLLHNDTTSSSLSSACLAQLQTIIPDITIRN